MDKLMRYADYAIERCLKTGAQSALALIGGGGLGLFTVDWVQVISISGLAMVMSLLTSVLQYDRPKGDADV